MKPTILFFATLFFASLAAPAGVYKWTDESGKIHFSDKPHKNADELNIPSSKPSGIGTSNYQLRRQKELLLQYSDERLSKQQEQARIDKREAKIAEGCQRLKSLIVYYKGVDYLFTRDAAGKKKRLSGARKEKEIAALQKKYAANCL